MAKRTYRDTEGRDRGRREVRWRAAASATIGIVAIVVLAASLFGAPLVAILLVGILLVCPLMMWIPFRLERGPRQGPSSERNGPTP